MKKLLAIILCLLIFGCEITKEKVISIAQTQYEAQKQAEADKKAQEELQAKADAEALAKADPEYYLPFKLSEVVWLHTGGDIQFWARTKTITSCSVDSRFIHFPNNCESWDVGGCIGNIWIIVQKADGKWYAEAWDWVKTGNKNLKGKQCIDNAIYGKLMPWNPVVGETYYFFLSGYARGAQRTVRERTNIMPAVWR